MTKRIYGLSGAVGLATLAMLSGAQLRAQTPAFDARWQAWLGCWQPSEAVSAPGAKPSGVCVSPINGSSAVEVTTVQEGAVAARDTIDASGAERRIDKQGCAGTQVGQWSADNRRVFVHSAMTCTGGLSRTGNAIIAMTPFGDWVNVQTLTVGNSTGVRALHYRDANSLKLAPPDVANAIGDRQLAINAARTEAGATIDVPAVLEAVHRTDTTAVQSWIIERGTKFNLNARQIVALADAGIPSSVTDVMIGVSYPDHFALKPSAPTVGGFGNAADVAMADRTSCASLTSGYARSACERCRDGWGYDSLYGMDSTDCGLGYRYGYSAYGPFGYGYGYGSGYGYGYGYPYYGYSSAPVVVVKGEDQPHGRVVNGHGYTQHPSSGSSGSAGGSSSSGSYSGSTGSSGASTSSAPSSGSSGSSGGGETRTAHPRPPM